MSKKYILNQIETSGQSLTLNGGTKLKPWYKSKTIWFNIIVAGLTALEASFSMLQPNIPVSVYGVLLTVLTVGNAALRIISTSTITFKE
jgi:hypothetical protein